MSRTEKIRIRVIKFGYFPFDLHTNMIKKWKSKLFEIVGDVSEHTSIERQNDAQGRQSSFFSDEYLNGKVTTIEKQFKDKEYEFLFVISNVKLKDDWYSRILAKNKVIFSYKSVVGTLLNANIPLENAIIMMLYTYSLLYKKNGKVPNVEEEEEFLHEDSRGCIFDLSDIVEEIVYSCASPIICEECRNGLRNIDTKLLNDVQNEIKRIKRYTSQRIASIIRRKPLISGTLAILLPVSISIFITVYLSKLSPIILNVIIFLPILLFLILTISANKSK